MTSLGAGASSPSATLLFKIHFESAFGERLVVTGSVPELGSWAIDAALPLAYEAGGFWVGRATVPVAGLPSGASVEYKYAVVNAAAPTKWEHGGNRQAFLPAATSASAAASVVYELRDTWRVRWLLAGCGCHGVFLRSCCVSTTWVRGRPWPGVASPLPTLSAQSCCYVLG